MISHVFLIIGPKGVRKDHDNDCVRNITYLLGNPKVGLGVRNENIEYMIKKKDYISKNMLVYNKPCVCGSLLHRNTKDPECFLNIQYIDSYK